MKKLLIFIFLLISLVGFSQDKKYYSYYPTRANFIAIIPDSASHIAKGCGFPAAYNAYPTKIWPHGAAMYADTCNNKLYFYRNHTWVNVPDSTAVAVAGANRFGKSGEDNNAAEARSMDMSRLTFTIDSINSLNLRSYGSGADSTLFRIQINRASEKLVMGELDNSSGLSIYAKSELGTDDQFNSYILNEVRMVEVDGAVFSTIMESADSSMTITGSRIYFIIDSTRPTSFFRINTLKTAPSDANMQFLVRDSTTGNVYRSLSSGGGGGETLQQTLDLGSTLTSDETISTGSNTLTISATGDTPLSVSTTNAFSNALNVSATSGIGIFSNTTTGGAGLFMMNPSTTNTVEQVVQIRRMTDATAADGIGGGIEFITESSSGSTTRSGTLNSFWSTADHATRTSQWDFIGVDNTAEETFMNIQASGVVRVNNLADTLATKAYARSVGGGVGITVGTTTITSGTDTRVPFNDAGVYNEDAGLVYDKTNNVLTAGAFSTTSPAGTTWINFYGDNITYFRTPVKINSSIYDESDVVWNLSTSAIRFDRELDMKDISAPSTPASGYGSVYVNSDKLNFKSDAGTVYILEYLAHGTYTPTLTGVTNVAASTAYACQYIRVGNTVTVSGQLDVDPTGTGSTQIDVSLPIASAITAVEQIGGAGASVVAGTEAAWSIQADNTNDRAKVFSIAGSANNQTVTFTFTYLIL